MPPIHFSQIYFLAVGLFATFVAAVGLLMPQYVDYAIPWLVPPLHARMIGSFYLGGMVLMFGALRQPAGQVWAMIVLATIWTGVLLGVSFLWIADFNWMWWPVRFWWLAYLVFPVAGFGLAWRHHRAAALTDIRPVSALLLGALAAGLLLLPEQAAHFWPWALPKLLSQIYSGPLFGLSIGIWLVARRGIAQEMQLLNRGLFVLVAAILLASILHLPLFDSQGPATWLWFVTLFVALARIWRNLRVLEWR